MGNVIKKSDNFLPTLMRKVEDKIVEVRGQQALLDRDVASVYGVETKRVNEAVRNNPRKFPDGYVFELTEEESAVLRSKFSTLEGLSQTLESSTGKGRHTKYKFKAFTRKGLYMLATTFR